MKAFFRERLRITVFIAIIFLLTIFALQIVFKPLFFVVHGVSVSGQAYLSESEVFKSSGIVRGESLITLSCKQAVRLLEANPWIKKAEVLKEWPTSVTITIEERVPCLAIPYHNNFILVSDDGVALDVRNDFSSINLPILNGYVLDEVETNSSIMSEEQWQKVKKVYENIPDNFMLQLSEIYWYRDQMSLITVGGLEISLGNINEFDHVRLKMLPEILKNIPDEKSGFLDLSGIYAVFRKL